MKTTLKTLVVLFAGTSLANCTSLPLSLQPASIPSNTHILSVDDVPENVMDSFAYGYVTGANEKFTCMDNAVRAFSETVSGDANARAAQTTIAQNAMAACAADVVLKEPERTEDPLVAYKNGYNVAALTMTECVTTAFNAMLTETSAGQSALPTVLYMEDAMDCKAKAAHVPVLVYAPLKP